MSNCEPGTPDDSARLLVTNSSGQSPCSVIGVGTLVRYLLGFDDAILALGGCRQSLWLGLIFVLSAGFAREYDGEDLFHEPWHLFLPLAASLGTSFILFGLANLPRLPLRADRKSFFIRYRAFLGLYWLTAPLAWIYAIPVERFLSAGQATETNLWFLGIVSVWRIFLISRVLSVLYRTSFANPFFIVMLFADTLAIVLVSFIDLPLFVVMGGVRLTETESILMGTKLLVTFFGVVSWLIWFFGSVVAWSGCSKWIWVLETQTKEARITVPLKYVATISILLWGFVLPWTQPEQRLRHSVESPLRAGRYRDALDAMSRHHREDFPPHWDPPPRIGSSSGRLRILNVVEAMSSSDLPWVRELFVNKLDAALGRHSFPVETLWLEVDIDQILNVLESIPEGETILRDKQHIMSQAVRWRYDDSSEIQKRVDQTLIRLANPPPDPPAGAWSDEQISAWHDFLNQLYRIEDRQLALGAYEGLLKSVLNVKESVPEPILSRVRELLEP